jgi:hypothetical protein
VRRELTTAALIAVLGSPAFGQSLGEVAAREKERREKLKQKSGAAAKTYTDEDLAKAEAKRPKESTSTSSSATVSKPADRETNGESGADYWKDRAEKARGAVKSAQDRIKALEDRIADLRLDRNPNPADQFDPNRLQKREAEIAKALADVDVAKADLATAQSDQEKLEAEARAKSIPPGWLR